MALTNLRMSSSEQGENLLHADNPDYPWGTQVTLDPDVLNRLNLDGLPKIGDVMPLQAQVEVIGINQVESRDGKQGYELRLQITDMNLGGNDEQDRAQAMFGGDNGNHLGSA